MKKILLVGLQYDRNYGDPVISDSCLAILKNEVLGEEYEYICVDMTGKISSDRYPALEICLGWGCGLMVSKMIALCTHVFRMLRCTRVENWLVAVKWKFTDDARFTRKTCKRKIAASDVIIFVGGGIVKYKYQDFYSQINYITKEAEKHSVPVYLNSVGVEGIDLRDARCRLLKKALNRDCVKMITTRDDIQTLKKYIENKNIVLGKVSDPAVYASKAYNIKRKKSDVVGLNVARWQIFQDNGIAVGRGEILELWAGIIDELTKRGIKWVIYTNGLDADNEFARDLAEFVGRKDKVIIPESPIDLVKIISSKRFVIATRLHSAIISYSFGVPAVGIVWNDKLKMFGREIGHSERFFEVESLDAKGIVDGALKAEKEGYSVEASEFIQSEIDSLKKIKI